MLLLIVSLDMGGFVPALVTGHQLSFRATLKTKLSVTFSRVFWASAPEAPSTGCPLVKLSVPSLVCLLAHSKFLRRERVVCLHHPTQGIHLSTFPDRLTGPALRRDSEPGSSALCQLFPVCLLLSTTSDHQFIA